MEMIPFTYQDSPVRTVENDGHILFCGKDVATALGYKDPKNALKMHCKGVVKHHPLQTPGGIQQFRFITEGDLYRLVASSKLPTAQNFESWVFDEVLPSIRKRGGYLTPEATAEALTDPDFIIRLATDLKAERAKRAQLEVKNREVEARAEESEHRLDVIENSAGFTPREFHKQYFPDTQEREFFNLLYRKRILIDQRGTRGRDKKGRLKNGYQHGHPAAAGKPYFFLAPGYIDPETERRYYTTKVRPGRPEAELVELLTKWGFTPNQAKVKEIAS